MKQENLQALFQAVVNTFVAERDIAISKMNRAINEGSPDAEEIVLEQMRNLTIAKMNIANTQEEVAIIQRKLQEQSLKQKEPEDKFDENAPSGNRSE